MKKQEVRTITKTRSVTYTLCDDCNNRVSHKSHCTICRKDLCGNCIGHEIYNGDNVDVYCKTCWTIGIDYLDKINKLEDKIEQLNEEWVSKCKDAFYNVSK